MSIDTTGAISGVTAAALGSIGVKGAARAVVVISGLTSETVDVKGKINASLNTVELRPINLSTGVVESTDSELSNGSFLFDNLAYDALVFTKSSTSESPVITVRTT